MNLILFPAPARIMFNKNKRLVLPTGAESGKDKSAYLQNSLFVPTHHSQGKDIKVYKKYWHASEMGLTIFWIRAFIYRPVKVGFKEQINHLPLFLKLAYSLSLHFIGADAGGLSYPGFAWILLSEQSLSTLPIPPSGLLLLKFISFQFTNFLSIPLVLLMPLSMCCHLFFPAEVWRTTELHTDAVG